MHNAVGGGHGGAVTADTGRLVQPPTACRIARIHLLGPMRATNYLGDDILPLGKKARALLACAGREAVKSNPSFSGSYKPLIATLGHLGRAQEAEPYIATLLTLEPNFTVERHSSASAPRLRPAA